MMWLSAVFQVWFIKDYRRMKEAENATQYKLWRAKKVRDHLAESYLFLNDEVRELEKDFKEKTEKGLISKEKKDKP